MASRIRIIIAFLLFFVPSAQAGLVETYFNYGPTSTVTNTNLNGNFDNIRNVLNGGINGDNISTANGWRLIEILSSSPAAGNQGRVVFLTSNNTLNFDTGSSFITTAVLPNNQTFSGNNTFNGTSTFGGTVTANSSFSANGTTNTIGNGGSDTLTLNVPGGMTLSAATTWTLTGALTFSGTIADLGTVTTANIDGGTMDGVQIGGTTATGELIVNDSNDDADGLGSQGTSGQFLQSAGAGANPTWVNSFKFISATAISSSNSGDITIAASKIYRVIISITNISADDTVSLRVNSSAVSYADLLSGGGTRIILGQMDSGGADIKWFMADLVIDTFATGDTVVAKVSGSVLSYNNGGTLTRYEPGGRWGTVSPPVTNFEIYAEGGATITGNVYVYEMPLS